MAGIGNHTTNIQTLRRYIDAAERKALDPLGLTVAQFEAMDTLSRNPGVSAAELATCYTSAARATPSRSPSWSSGA